MYNRSAQGQRIASLHFAPSLTLANLLHLVKNLHGATPAPWERISAYLELETPFSVGFKLLLGKLIRFFVVYSVHNYLDLKGYYLIEARKVAGSAKFK